MGCGATRGLSQVQAVDGETLSRSSTIEDALRDHDLERLELEVEP